MPVAGVPVNVPVPLPLSTNVTPLGNAPTSVSEGVGVPALVTVNVPRVPTVNVVLLALVITGAVPTVRVKVCVAVVPTPLLAVKAMEYVPTLPDAGVPVSVSVPFAPLVKVMPLGNAPVSVKVDAGKPAVITVNDPEVPTVNVAVLALVIVGASSTVSVKPWLAAEPTPLPAINVMGYVLPVPVAGIPPKVPVPFPLSVKVTPLGSGPDSVRLGAGEPVAVTGNAPVVPATNVTVFTLVIAGAWLTMMSSTWVADCGPIVLESLTFTVKLALPSAVGVPAIAPALLRVRPAGSEPPLMVKVRAPVPPEAAMV